MPTDLGELRRVTDDAVSTAEDTVAAIEAHARGDVDAYAVIELCVRVRDAANDLEAACRQSDPNVLAVVTFLAPTVGAPIIAGMTRFTTLVETVKSFCYDHARHIFGASTN